MIDTELLENNFSGMENPFTKLAEIAIDCLESDRDGFSGYRTKLASNNINDKYQGLTNAYIDSFFGVFDKTASETQEYIAASKLGELFGQSIMCDLIKQL